MKIVFDNEEILFETCNASIFKFNVGDILVYNNSEYKVISRVFPVDKLSLIKDDYGINRSNSKIYVRKCTCDI